MSKKNNSPKQTFALYLTSKLVEVADKMSFHDHQSRSSFVDKLIDEEAKRRGIKTDRV